MIRSDFTGRPTQGPPIEELQVGDLVTSRPEDDVTAAVGPQRVQAVQERVAEILTLTVGGQTIQSTTEHPFFVQDQGWTEAQELQPGDLLSTSEGRWVAIESIHRDRQPATVYNLTVDYWHTYFLGTPNWGFDVWVHNNHNARITAPNKGPLWTSTKNKSGVENAFGHFKKHGAEFP